MAKPPMTPIRSLKPLNRKRLKITVKESPRNKALLCRKHEWISSNICFHPYASPMPTGGLLQPQTSNKFLLAKVSPGYLGK
jgi:hypothetical protein